MIIENGLAIGFVDGLGGHCDGARDYGSEECQYIGL